MANNEEMNAYAGLGATSIGYALLLNTTKGKQFASEYTWASVVAGTGLVLLALYFILPRQYWQKVTLAFVLAGSPMIVRSLVNKSTE